MVQTRDPVVNINELIEPIAEDNPTGSDIREDPAYDSIYRTIKDARGSARAAERDHMFDETLSNEATDYWKKVVSLAPEILKNKAKDLDVCSWFIEAEVRLNGLQGLSECFTLTRQLIELYWDGLYPTPDDDEYDDGLKARVSSFVGLNGGTDEGVLIAPIRNVLLTDPKVGKSFSYFQYQQATEAKRTTDDKVRAAKIRDLGFSLEDIQTAVNKCGGEFYVELRDDVLNCVTEFKLINELFTQHCGSAVAPGTRHVFSVLDEFLRAINYLAKDILPKEIVENENNDAVENGEAVADGGTGGNKLGGSINSREAAFKQLLLISDFFLKTEPHSPVAYVLAKAVKWGNMNLNELIGELIPDESSRNTYSSLTGVKADETNEN
ncbi:MAG: type VI secretion system protein TssA [Gammaproteobacteria bacterium]|nr:MAG: type VI secretion system protein TssA [Gammaproteobacteria bacterium]